MMIINKILRVILFAIDWAVYKCVDLLYQLILLLSETSPFSDGHIQSFASRIYFFLGLIMVFKVSISIINYIMNPDSLKDSKIGASKLLKNIIIILIGIVMVPYIFEAAYSLQRIVLKDNVIGSLILGQQYSSSDKSKVTKEAGQRMAFTTFTAFFNLNEDYFSEECRMNPFEIKDGEYTGEISQSCSSYSQFTDFMQTSAGEDYKEAYMEKNIFKMIKNGDVYNAQFNDENGNSKHLFDYIPIVSTLAGGFIAYVLLVFCFDIALRSVKLGFLQLIAPIPLIAKVDPKKGDEVFNKWVKECINTYLLLFIRLVAIYFAIYLIDIITDGPFNVLTGDKQGNIFVKIFIIFGTLLFVKDLPDLIKKITGAELGKDGLNLRKKVAATPLIGNATTQGTSTLFRSGRKMLTGDFKGAGKEWSNYGHRMVNGALNQFGVLDRQLDRLEDEKSSILDSQRDEKDLMSRRDQVIDANKAVMERAKKKVAESEIYAQKKMEVQRLKDLAEQKQARGEDASSEYAAAATAEAAFNKWANKDGVYEYIDKSGNFANRGNDIVLDHNADGTGLMDKRDAVASQLSGVEEYSFIKPDGTKMSAKEADDYAGELTGKNTKSSSDLVASNQRVKDIDEQERSKKQAISSSKPYMPFGPKK